MSLRVFTSTDFTLALPEGHRFPAEKYELLRQRLVAEGIVPPDRIMPSPTAGDRDILRVHTSEYVEGLKTGAIDPKILRRLGFPWSEHLHRRGLRTVGGALAAARYALRYGLSGQLAGGTHHAHGGFGAGFCIYNDFAIVCRTLLAEGLVGKIAIVDLDVHQGDGNAAILTGEPSVFILDLHGAKNFPFRKVPSGGDVPLPDGCNDAEYLAALEENLPRVFAFEPDLVLYQAGVDGLHSDRLGRMDLSFEGLMARDHLVLEGCHRRGIPVSMAIGGGYAEPISDTVSAYANTYRVARSIYPLLGA